MPGGACSLDGRTTGRRHHRLCASICATPHRHGRRREAPSVSDDKVPGSDAEARRDGTQSSRLRVAIVGGGCAGRATAWQLRRLNRQRGEQLDALAKARDAGDAPAADAFEQRLADWPATKSTSAKPTSSSAAKARRRASRMRASSMHGMHVRLGFYENAFRLVREVCDECAGFGFGPDAADVRSRRGRAALTGAPNAHAPASNTGSTGTCSALARWLVFAARAMMAISSPCCCAVMPLALAAAVCECTQ